MEPFWQLPILTIMSGCQESSFENNHTIDKGKVVEETMTPSVHVDPAIDLSSKQTTSIIIEFKTKPAKVAVIEAEAKGIPLTIEEANGAGRRKSSNVSKGTSRVIR